MQNSVQFRSPYPGVSGTPTSIRPWSFYESAPTGQPAAQIQVPLMIAIVNHVEAPSNLAGTRRILHDLFRVVTRKPQRVPSTEVRQHFSDALEWVSETDRPLIVTNHGRPEAVILSFGVFERMAKGVAQAVLALGSKRSGLSEQAEDLLEEEGAALARRFRQGGMG